MRLKIGISMFARKLQCRYYKLTFTMTDIKSEVEIAENWNSGEKLRGSSKFILKELMKENADQKKKMMFMDGRKWRVYGYNRK